MGLDEELNLAIETIKRGDRITGGRMLSKILKEDPKNERAWLWLSACLDDVEKKRYCLNQVRKIAPRNRSAVRALARLGQPTVPAVQFGTGQAEQPTVDQPAVKPFTAEGDSSSLSFEDLEARLRTFGFAEEDGSGKPSHLSVDAAVSKPDLPPQQKPTRLLPSILIGFVLICCLCTAATAVLVELQRIKMHTVEYIISGSSPNAVIRYTDDQGETIRVEAPLPFSADYSMRGLTSVSLVAVDENGSGNLSCEIKVDGEVWRKYTADKSGESVMCMGLLGTELGMGGNIVISE